MDANWTEASKTIYVPPRHPVLTREVFRPRWRMHGVLAMQLPIWEHACRYIQCDAISGLDRRLGLPETSADHWGVGLVWLRNVDALRAMTTHPEFPRLYDDELEAFGEQVEHFMLLAQEAVLHDDGRTKVKLTGFFTGAPGVGRSALWSSIDRWALDADPPAAGPPGQPCKVVLNRPLDFAYVGLEEHADATVRAIDISAPSTSRFARYDGVVELGFADPLDAAAYLAEHDGGLAPASWRRLVDPDGWLVLATNEISLYDDR